MEKEVIMLKEQLNELKEQVKELKNIMVKK